MAVKFESATYDLNIADNILFFFAGAWSEPEPVGVVGAERRRWRGERPAVLVAADRLNVDAAQGWNSIDI